MAENWIRFYYFESKLFTIFVKVYLFLSLSDSWINGDFPEFIVYLYDEFLWNQNQTEEQSGSLYAIIILYLGLTLVLELDTIFVMK